VNKMNDSETLVHVDLAGAPVLVGRLWSRARKGRESASFEYDKSWLEHPERFALEPALTLGPGAQDTEAGKALFGALGDSAPDRWGRVLMQRAERKVAQQQGRAARASREIDFLLRVDDEAREGALRFAQRPNGPFLAPADTERIPPVVNLPRLLAASERVADDTDTAEDLRLLLAPGSSLRGAWPKAAVREHGGQLAIAKFPHKDDYADVESWEALSLRLARNAGIRVPDSRIESINGKNVLIVRRFDREGDTRISFLSAMSMLGAKDNERHSYLEIADAIMQHGAQPGADLKELWSRIVFTVLISNTDDHLRNHGFLYDGPRGWRLSPAFDLNPVPTDVKDRVLHTSISADDPTASLEIAMAEAEYFGLSAHEARHTAGVVGAAVSGWRKQAGALGLNKAAIDRMASAFEHVDLEQALQFNAA
jgi:serine/threonine-protein kinase HipA